MVTVKKYPQQTRVPLVAIRQALSALRDSVARVAMFISTSSYTDAAIGLSEGSPVVHWSTPRGRADVFSASLQPSMIRRDGSAGESLTSGTSVQRYIWYG